MSDYIENNAPSVEEYILYVGTEEAIEQSNPDDATATEPEENRIEFAIELAKADVLGTFCVACPAGQVFISKMIKPLILDIARYRLDTIKRRDDIKEAYDKACQLLERATSDEICSKDINKEDAELFGIEYCPAISFTAEERVWTRDKLRDFREQSYIRGSSRRRLNSPYRRSKW